jgi:hypothetical protein
MGKPEGGPVGTSERNQGDIEMSKNLRKKWGLMIAGSALFTLQLGQCIGDFIEDAIIFSIVD